MTATTVSPVQPRNRLLVAGAQNVLWAGLQLVGRSFSGLLIPRLLSSASYDAYAYLTWLVMIFVQLGTFGLAHAAQRYIPQASGAGEQHGVARCLRATASVTILLLLVVLVLWQLASPFGPWGYGLPALVLLVAAGVLGVYSSVEIGILKGRRNFAYPAIVEGIAQGIRLGFVGVLFLVRVHVTFTIVFAAEAIYWLLQAVGLYVRRDPGVRSASLDRAQVRGILAYSTTVGAVILVDVVVWQRIEVGLLKWFGFAQAAGFFYLASQIATLLTMLPGVAVLALFPAFAEFQRRDPGDLKALYAMAATCLWLVAVPILAIGLFVVPMLLRAVYGPPYGQVAVILPFVLVGRSFLLIGSAASTLIYAAGEQSRLLKITLLGAAATLICDLFFIPTFGLVGAGISVVVVQPLVAMLTLWLVSRILVPVPVRVSTVVVGVVSLAFGASIARLGWSLLGAVGAMMVYAVVCSRDPAVRALLRWMRGQLSNLSLAHASAGQR